MGTKDNRANARAMAVEQLRSVLDPKGLKPLTPAEIADLIWFDSVGLKSVKNQELPGSDSKFSDKIAAVLDAVKTKEDRHAAGQYQTPSYICNATSVLLKDADVLSLKIVEPCVGTGQFVCELLRIAKAAGAGNSKILKWLQKNVLCLDVDPIAIDLAKVAIIGTCIELGISKDLNDVIETLPSFLHIDLLQLADENSSTSKALRQYQRQYDLVIGNPPWLGWEYISEKDREIVKKRFSGTRLLSEKGWRARVAAGKIDLSTVIVLTASDYFLRPNASALFVLPLAHFKTLASGSAFRQFITASGRDFCPTSFIKFTGSDHFADAQVRAISVLWKMDQQCSFPINGYVYDESGVVKTQATSLQDDQTSGPWIFSDESKNTKFGFDAVYGQSAYRAREGVNTGGANGIFWVDVIDESEGCVEIKNSGDVGRAKFRSLSGIVESKVIHPLARGRDAKRWHCSPSTSIFCPYDGRFSKNPFPEKVFSDAYPLAYLFIRRFKKELSERKEYIRWGARNPFYELFRIGPYTFSKNRVIWQHTGFSGSFRASLLESDQANVIPDQKIILVPVESSDEGHYLVSLMNSKPVAVFLRSFMLLDASPQILNYIGITSYDAENDLHKSLSILGKKAKLLAKSGRVAELAKLETEIDVQAAKYFRAAKTTAKNKSALTKERAAELS